MRRRPHRQGGGRAGAAVSLSLALHLLALALVAYHGRVPAPRPAPPLAAEKFVKRLPPAQRPLSRRPTPQPRPRPLQRAPAATAGPPLALRPQPRTSPRAALPGLPIPLLSGPRSPAELPVLPALSPTALRAGPHWQAGRVDGAVEGVRQGAEEIDLRLELLGVEALDTGRHRALVVVDPKDRRNLQGFLYLSSIYSQSIERAEQSSTIARRARFIQAHPDRQVAEREALQGLAEQMNRHTQVRTQVLDGLALDDPRLLQAPFLLLTVSAPFEFTRAEARNLGQYLLAGGFVYAEVVRPLNQGQSASRDDEVDLFALRDFIRQALAEVEHREGRDWRFERLPMSHPLFHCYYELASLPRGFRDMWFWYWNQDSRAVPTPSYLEGILVGGQMVGVYSLKNYADFWAGLAERIREDNRRDSFVGVFDIGGEELPVYKLGVNLLVYALTREGSLAQRRVAAE